ncbi:hypothetical protein EXIGLDRAFT_729918 [Exidia glandulosa HHB12029]|uniref:F-box domain-containing protein n=1 Tax=Exidia glandulosa HHB12029 TaxID=1314781 RepID=A0A165ZFS6_EXIGL|nr:hypothetical protein EXIGLDRAFT_729918 [Exidia glandulosa HHB12029]
MASDAAVESNTKVTRIFSVLPLELVCIVFECLPLRDCILATHVCRAWRHFLVDCAPSIWCSISSEPILPPGALPVLLARSGSSDIELSVRVALDRWKEVVDCLAANMYRCRSLSVRISSARTDDYTDMTAALTSALCNPAPRMRKFRLFDRGGLFNSPGILGGVAPHLRVVKLYCNPGALGECEAFQGATRAMYANPSWTTHEDVSNILQRLPKLEALALDLDYWHRWGTGRRNDHILVFPPTLKHLVLRGDSEVQNACLVLDAIDHSKLHEICVTCPSRKDGTSPDPEFVEKLLRQMLDDGPPAVKMSIYGSSFLDISIKRADDSERGLIRVPRGRRPEQSFSTVTLLSLGESALDPNVPFPSIPLVTDLTIIMLDHDEYADVAHDSVFLLPRTHDDMHILVCPSLRIFRIRASKGAARVAPEVIREFVEYHLDYAEPLLEKLAICGAEVLHNNVAEVAALISLAKTFEPGLAVPWGSWNLEDIWDWR